MNIRIQQFKTEENQSEYLFHNNAEKSYITNSTDTNYANDTA